MMDRLSPPHPEMVLQYPVDFPDTPGLDLNGILNALTTQQRLAPLVPYKWTFIDKPREGQVFMISLPKDILPPDGIIWLEKETRSQMPKVPGGVDVECYQTTQGYLPGNDNMVCRIRRRFRFPAHRGYNPNLWLVHYTRNTQPGPRVTMEMTLKPPRNYPLPHMNPMYVFIAGSRINEAVSEEEALQLAHNANSAAAAVSSGGRHGGGGGGGNAGPTQQEIMAQTAAMRQLAAKREGTKAWARRQEEEDSGDEDVISMRTLAMSRYRRNHELMEEALYHAAFGPEKTQPGDDEADLEKLQELLVKATNEVAELKQQAEERQRAKAAREAADEVMM